MARHGTAMLIHHRSSSGNTNGEALSSSSKTLALHEPDTDHTPTKDKNLMKIRREHKVCRNQYKNPGCVMSTENILVYIDIFAYLLLKLLV